jgi:hypothetical protein
MYVSLSLSARIGLLKMSLKLKYSQFIFCTCGPSVGMVSIAVEKFLSSACHFVKVHRSAL